MPPRKKITRLPKAVQAFIDRFLIDNHFAEYRALEAALAEKGYSISKSALQAHGKGIERQLAAIKIATEQARAVVEAAPDREGNLNDALIRLVQNHLFQFLVDAENPEKLPQYARAIAELGKSTVLQKKWAEDAGKLAREEVLREQAEALDKAVASGGMNEEQAAFWRRDFLGVR